MQFKIITPLILVISLLGNSANADIAVGVNGGTTGVGVNLTVGVLDKVNLRGIYGGFNYDNTDSQDGIDYDYEIDLSYLGLLVDFHPFGGGLRISAGAYNNGTSADVIGDPNGTFEFGNGTFNASDIDEISAEVDFKSLAPYLGIGWGNAVKEGKTLGFSVDFGVLFQGAPNVDLTATASNPAVQPLLDAEVEEEEEDIQQELEDFDLYPVAVLSVTLKF